MFTSYLGLPFGTSPGRSFITRSERSIVHRLGYEVISEMDNAVENAEDTHNDAAGAHPHPRR